MKYHTAIYFISVPLKTNLSKSRVPRHAIRVDRLILPNHLYPTDSEQFLTKKKSFSMYFSANLENNSNGKDLFALIFFKEQKMEYLNAFWVGGLICVIGQILIDKTKLTPARILTGFVVAGVILGAVGLYKPLVDFASAGASVPISGFGFLMTEGVKEALKSDGALGILTGGLTSAAGGIAAAIFFGLVAGLVTKSGDKF